MNLLQQDNTGMDQAEGVNGRKTNNLQANTVEAISLKANGPEANSPGADETSNVDTDISERTPLDAESVSHIHQSADASRSSSGSKRPSSATTHLMVNNANWGCTTADFAYACYVDLARLHAMLRASLIVHHVNC